MKLSFLLPNYKIQLLKPGTLNHTLNVSKQYAYQFEAVKESGITEIPKNSTLTVGQIYIRKNGYYENGITFKLTYDEKNPLCMAMLQAVVNSRLKNALSLLNQEKHKLELLNNGSHSVAVEQLGRWDGISHPVINVWYYDTPVASLEQGNIAAREILEKYGKNNKFMYNISIRPEVEKRMKELENDIISLTNRTKGAFTYLRGTFKSSVIRIRLPDIEEWDVKIIEKAIEKPK